MVTRRRKPECVPDERDSTTANETRQPSSEKTVQETSLPLEPPPEDEAVKTFFVDVTAGESAKVSAGDRPHEKRKTDTLLQNPIKQPFALPRPQGTSLRDGIDPAIKAAQQTTHTHSDSPLPPVGQAAATPPPQATLKKATLKNIPALAGHSKSKSTAISPVITKRDVSSNKNASPRLGKPATTTIEVESADEPAEKATSRLEALHFYFRNLSSFGVSLLLHLFLLVLLSFYTLASLQKEPELELLSSVAPLEEVVEFSEIEIDPTENLKELSDELEPDSFETDDLKAGQSPFSELTAKSSFAEVATGPGMVADGLGDLGEIFGNDGQGLSDLGAGKGKGSTNFFGSRTQARRIVYLIDNTGSMTHGGLETVIVELLKSITTLEKNQQFYILFFSDQVYPLFFPQSSTVYIRPTEKNLQNIRNWLDTVECCTGGVWQLLQGLEIASNMRPDVIYLLSDGRDWRRVRAQHKVEGVQNLLTTTNVNQIPIHTLGMGCQRDIDRENLAAVAKNNSGTFREVQIHPDMIEQAKRNNRPYHNQGPGKVWGSKVPKRKAT
ncbi:MAG: vWA domain-containing protein [Pirellulales bacterium]